MVYFVCRGTGRRFLGMKKQETAAQKSVGASVGPSVASKISEEKKKILETKTRAGSGRCYFRIGASGGLDSAASPDTIY